jgi:hypothetical protein
MRGASPIRGTLSTAPPPPTSYVPVYHSDRNGYGSFSSSSNGHGAHKAPVVRSSSTGNGAINGTHGLTYKAQDLVASIMQLLDDSKLPATEKAQVLTTVSHKIGMR